MNALAQRTDADALSTSPSPPGVSLGVRAEDYHAAPGLSKSDLDLIARSPAHYRYGERKETPAMELGTAIHCGVLEPEAFEKRYFLGEDCRRGTNAWKKLQEAAGERILLKPADWDTCQHIREAVHAHPAAGALLCGELNTEVSAWGQLEIGGLLLKCRPDAVRRDWRCLIDLKSTEDAAPRAFQRSVTTYRYQVQMAFYLDVFSAAAAEPFEDFVFVAVEKSPPYAVACYELDAAALAHGRRLYQRDLETYRRCMASGHWPAYAEELITLSLPPWAIEE